MGSEVRFEGAEGRDHCRGVVAVGAGAGGQRH